MPKKEDVMERKWMVKAISLSTVFLLAATCGWVGETGAAEPIKIGILAPFSGVYAQQGEKIEKGFKLALKEANYEVAGRKIVTVTEDTELKPDVAVTKARKLLERDKVHFIVGGYASTEVQGVHDFAAQKKFPYIIIGGGVTEKIGGLTPYVYRTSHVGGQYSAANGIFAREIRGYKKAIWMAPDYLAFRAMFVCFKKYFEERGGKVVQEIWTPFPTTDFSPYIGKFNKEADVVYQEYSGADGSRFMSQFKEYGMWKFFKMMSGGSIMLDIVRGGGDAAIGVEGANFYCLGNDSPENKRFIELYQSTYKEDVDDMNTPSYDGGMAVLLALKKIEGKIENTEAFLGALGDVKFIGPRGPFEFDKAVNSVLIPEWMRRVAKKDGKLVQEVVDPPKYYLIKPSVVIDIVRKEMKW
jgi:branched-chain amino acid transport system substrate-binding protein